MQLRYWQRQDLEDIPIGYQLVANEDINNGSGNSTQELSQPQGLLEKENMSKKTGSDPSEDWYRMGRKTLGIGLVTTAVGWLLIGVALNADSDNDGLAVFGGIGVVAGVTVGPAAILAGLITLAIGSSQ